MHRICTKPPLLRLTMPVSGSGGGFIIYGIALVSPSAGMPVWIAGHPLLKVITGYRSAPDGMEALGPPGALSGEWERRRQQFGGAGAGWKTGFQLFGNS